MGLRAKTGGEEDTERWGRGDAETRGEADDEFGTAGRVGGKNAQCSLYCAPLAIQRRNVSFCAGVSFLFESAGGMRSSEFVSLIRTINSLWSGFPGTIAGRPDLPPFKALSGTSSRSRPLREPSSGPWHLRQLSERIGRTSRE